jgi:hypothetical protein
MRATKIEVLHGHGRMPLVMRGRFERTFFGLGLFAAINLFLWGIYLLTEVIRDPLKANETAVIAAGFALALASFLIVYLVWPRGRSALARHDEFDRDPEYSKGPVLTVYGEGVQNRLEAKRGSGEEENLPGPM